VTVRDRCLMPLNKDAVTVHDRCLKPLNKDTVTVHDRCLKPLNKDAVAVVNGRVWAVTLYHSWTLSHLDIYKMNMRERGRENTSFPYSIIQNSIIQGQ
jgi:hypothetical protein